MAQLLWQSDVNRYTEGLGGCQDLGRVVKSDGWPNPSGEG